MTKEFTIEEQEILYKSFQECESKFRTDVWECAPLDWGRFEWEEVCKPLKGYRSNEYGIVLETFHQKGIENAENAIVFLTEEVYDFFQDRQKWEIHVNGYPRVGMYRRNDYGGLKITFQYSGERSTIDSTLVECPICTEAIVEGIVSKNCGHFACRKCFSKHKAHNVKENKPHDCPVCRKIIGSVEPVTNPTEADRQKFLGRYNSISGDSETRFHLQANGTVHLKVDFEVRFSDVFNFDAADKELEVTMVDGKQIIKKDEEKEEQELLGNQIRDTTFLKAAGLTPGGTITVRSNKPLQKCLKKRHIQKITLVEEEEFVRPTPLPMFTIYRVKLSGSHEIVSIQAFSLPVADYDTLGSVVKPRIAIFGVLMYGFGDTYHRKIRDVNIRLDSLERTSGFYLAFLSHHSDRLEIKDPKEVLPLDEDKLKAIFSDIMQILKKGTWELRIMKSFAAALRNENVDRYITIPIHHIVLGESFQNLLQYVIYYVKLHMRQRIDSVIDGDVVGSGTLLYCYDQWSCQCCYDEDVRCRLHNENHPDGWCHHNFNIPKDAVIKDYSISVADLVGDDLCLVFVSSVDDTPVTESSIKLRTTENHEIIGMYFQAEMELRVPDCQNVEDCVDAIFTAVARLERDSNE